MNKKFIWFFIIISILTIGVSLARAAVDIQNPIDNPPGPGGGECAPGETDSCQVTVSGTVYDGLKTCRANETWGACKVSCGINFAFTPSTVPAGQQYNRAWSSNDVVSMDGTCTNEDGAHYSWTDLPLALSQNFTAEAGHGTSCTLNGVSPTGNACTKTASLTVTTPPCSATAAWAPATVPSGNNSTLSWNVAGNFDDVKLFCNNVDLGFVGAPDSRTFTNITANKSCVVKGYTERETPNGGISYIQKCSSPAAVVTVVPPSCADGDTRSCTAGSETGVQTCNNNIWGTCVICTNGQTRSCIPPGIGGTGSQTCNNNSWGLCAPGPVCSPGQTQSCTVNGQSGTQSCTANGNWGTCAAVTHSISVAFSPAASGIGWSINGPASYSGSGSQTIPNVPNGTYSLGITGGWAGRVVTGIAQVISGNSFNFTISNRTAQTNKGTLSVSQPTLQDNQAQHVEGNAGDAADGGKTLILSKKFVRLSNGLQQQGAPAYGWRGITTGANGTFSADVTYRCVGTDPTSFGDGDYSDTSAVTYDQGDHTGDTSPSVTETKLCGTSISFDSQDDAGIKAATTTGDCVRGSTGCPKGNPLPLSWGISGPYSTWDPSQNRVTKSGSAAYSMRVDEGAYSLSVTPPAGYQLYGIFARGRHLTGSGFAPVCDSFPCNFVADRNHPYNFSIIWTPSGEGQFFCDPNSQTVQAGQAATLSGRGSFSGYSWSAPEGNPSSGTGVGFSTTYNSIGQKVVTVSSGGATKSCLVDVIPGNTPSPVVDLKINGSDGTVQVQPGQSVSLRWTTKDVNSCVASGDWSGSKSAAGGIEPKTLNSAGTYTFSITCHNNALNRNVSDTVRATVSSVSQLQVRLTPNPNSGDAPLDTALTAIVSGETGSINYNFWWNCNSAASTFVSAVADCGNPANIAIGKKLDSQTPETMSVNTTYTFPGTYIAKVIAERGSSSAEDRTTITVTGQTPFHLECISNTCAKVSGPGQSNCSGEGTSCGAPTHYECVANACSKVNGAGGDKDGCGSSNVGQSCTPGGGGNSHYGCVSNTCAKINSPGSDTDGCNSGNMGASCTPGGGGPGGPGTCTFTASPSLINKGSNTILSWKDCGNTCSITGVGGGFSGTGSASVSPAVPTTYTLSCDAGATIKTAKVSIVGLTEENPQ